MSRLYSASHLSLFLRLASAAVAVGAACLYLPAPPLHAQVAGSDPFQTDASREELVDLLDRFEKAASSPAYSDYLRRRTGQEAALLRDRLREGDFRVGDRILLEVENQPAISDTFTVGTGLVLTIPQVGDVQLRGILRAEVQDHLSEQLDRFLRTPRVRAYPLLRIGIVGGVGRPGFYMVPSDVPLSDIVMLAGGPTPAANLERIRIERGEMTVWEPELLRQATLEGRTLGQLDVRAGDVVVIPVRSTSSSVEQTLRLTTILLSIPVTLAALAAIFN